MCEFNKKPQKVFTRHNLCFIIKVQKHKLWFRGRVNYCMDKKTIAKKLLDLRESKSREEVSNELGISVSALQMYENGQRIPKDEIKIKIANYYKKSVQEIFFEQ